MGTIKNKTLETNNEDTASHELTSQEINLLKVINNVMVFNMHQQKVMSGFMYYIATNRLGYTPETNLLFEIYLQDESNILKVTVVSGE